MQINLKSTEKSYKHSCIMLIVLAKNKGNRNTVVVIFLLSAKDFLAISFEFILFLIKPNLRGFWKKMEFCCTWTTVADLFHTVY